MKSGTPLRICWTRYEPHFDCRFRFPEQPQREPEESERETVAKKSLDKSPEVNQSHPKSHGN